jgi:hypothetical protein
LGKICNLFDTIRPPLLLHPSLDVQSLPHKARVAHAEPAAGKKVGQPIFSLVSFESNSIQGGKRFFGKNRNLLFCTTPSAPPPSTLSVIFTVSQTKPRWQTQSRQLARRWDSYYSVWSAEINAIQRFFG